MRESNRLKRRAFAWSLLGMLTMVGVIALGAAADPATGRANTQAWTNFHLVGRDGRVRGDRLDLFRRLAICLANHAIIQQIVAEVARNSPRAGPGAIDGGHEISEFRGF